jgi:hypothetical protein
VWIDHVGDTDVRALAGLQLIHERSARSMRPLAI